MMCAFAPSLSRRFSKMKRRKRKTKPKFKVIYEYIPSPDAEERLNRAYDMLFDKILTV